MLGERDRAVREFERLLAARNEFGLLSEDIDVTSGRLRGNFPQTYSMVGIVMRDAAESTPGRRLLKRRANPYV